MKGPTNLTVVADEKSPSSLLRFLLWTGQPLHQPVVAYGPFVMNTKSILMRLLQTIEMVFLAQFQMADCNRD